MLRATIRPVVPVSVPLLPPTPSDDGERKQHTVGFGIFALLLGALTAAFAVVIIAACICCRRRISTVRAQNAKGVDDDGTLEGQRENRRASPAYEFTLDEVIAATTDFKIRIGKGGFGYVYYGKLPDGRDIAVKVLSTNSNQGSREFFTEVDLLSRVQHKNLVNLIGYCKELTKQILIYEYMPRGTLRESLYGPSISSERLDWMSRLLICLDAAQGLNYLHEVCQPSIIHRDVKSSNILLDYNMVAKVADFGLSKSAPEGDEKPVVSAVVRGTAGYIDPEYFATRIGTKKSDVFSFGVVLLEIICGREPLNSKLLDRYEWNIVEWARCFKGKLPGEDFIDSRLGENYSRTSLLRVLDIALQSTDPMADNRPDMSYIVEVLKEAVALEQENRLICMSKLVVDRNKPKHSEQTLNENAGPPRQIEQTPGAPSACSPAPGSVARGGRSDAPSESNSASSLSDNQEPECATFELPWLSSSARPFSSCESFSPANTEEHKHVNFKSWADPFSSSSESQSSSTPIQEPRRTVLKPRESTYSNPFSSCEPSSIPPPAAAAAFSRSKPSISYDSPRS